VGRLGTRGCGGLIRAHDLAVLQTAESLPACVAGLAATDEVAQRAKVSVTGVSEVPDPGHSSRYLDATGTAEGGTVRDGVPLARVEASAVVPGMSGRRSCPPEASRSWPGRTLQRAPAHPDDAPTGP
jgi:hypothetical protein